MLFHAGSGFGLDLPGRGIIGPHGNRLRYLDRAGERHRAQALRASQCGALRYPVVPLMDRSGLHRAMPMLEHDHGAGQRMTSRSS
jgi:hypothetical protein